MGRASSVHFREGQCRNRTSPPARGRPDITLFIEFPVTYQWVGIGYQLAASKGARGAILTVEGAAGNHEATVFSSVITIVSSECNIRRLRMRCLLAACHSGAGEPEPHPFKETKSSPKFYRISLGSHA